MERSDALGFVRQIGISLVKNKFQFPGMSNQQFSRSLEPGQMGSPRRVGPLPSQLTQLKLETTDFFDLTLKKNTLLHL